MLVFAALLGWVASRIPGRVKEGGFVDTSDIVAARQSQSNGVQYTDDEYMQVPANSRTTSGENAIWLNMRYVF